MLPESQCIGSSSTLKHVTIDFMGVLPMVVKHTQALLTPVETICFDDSKHKFWLTITCPHDASGMKYASSGIPVLLYLNLNIGIAKKAISYLMQQYNFTIIDANYKAINYATLLCS